MPFNSEITQRMALIASLREAVSLYPLFQLAAHRLQNTCLSTAGLVIKTASSLLA